MDELGIDVLLTGSQKALAHAAGARAFFGQRTRLRARRRRMKDRGYYFDFLEFQKNQAEDMTPSTPSISHIYALQSKLEDIFAEGVEARHARHARLNAKRRGLGGKKRLRVFRAGGLPLEIADLREEQPRRSTSRR